jgi:hypothetical protein
MTAMKRPCHRIVLVVAGLLCLAAVALAFPKPSPYPISWQFKFEHSTPKRVVITPRASRTPQAYWYMTYTLTNLGDRERMFLPCFEMMTEDGKVFRSDNDIPNEVLDTIRAREKRPSLESVVQIASTIRLGDDQARDGVAIWAEPSPHMGQFSIFVGGLSGESVILTDDKGQTVTQTTKDGKKEPVVLHRTFQIEYQIPGDETFPGSHEIVCNGEKWVMR